MLSFFSQDVLDEILDLIESVSDGFRNYSYDITNRNYNVSTSMMSSKNHKLCLKFGLIDTGDVKGIAHLTLEEALEPMKTRCL